MGINFNNEVAVKILCERLGLREQSMVAIYASDDTKIKRKRFVLESLRADSDLFTILEMERDDIISSHICNCSMLERYAHSWDTPLRIKSASCHELNIVLRYLDDFANDLVKLGLADRSYRLKFRSIDDMKDLFGNLCHDVIGNPSGFSFHQTFDELIKQPVDLPFFNSLYVYNAVEKPCGDDYVVFPLNNSYATGSLGDVDELLIEAENVMSNSLNTELQEDDDQRDVDSIVEKMIQLYITGYFTIEESKFKWVLKSDKKEFKNHFVDKEERREFTDFFSRLVLRSDLMSDLAYAKVDIGDRLNSTREIADLIDGHMWRIRSTLIQMTRYGLFDDVSFQDLSKWLGYLPDGTAYRDKV